MSENVKSGDSEKNQSIPRDSTPDGKSKTMFLILLSLALAGINFLSFVVIAIMIYQTQKKWVNVHQWDLFIERGLSSEGHANSNKDSHPETLEIYQFKDFVVNLAGSKGKKVLKVGLQIALNSPDAKSEVSLKEPQFRDQVIMILSSQTLDDVSTPAGRQKLRDTLKTSLNALLSENHKVMEVYFTEFIYN